ncbi:MAG: cupin [Cyanobacteria bacterium CRU_2_1]|nr:cupin [Cyanobacteria bacterium RU_5_0]NJR63872.1 cupin [Cyanobacteria bacterium CRU_2_1]
MEINANLNQRAVMVSEELPWVASPLSGVERRMLERDGEEIARATSIVRYAPGSCFSTHTHGGGEEFLVLEGIFSDEYGDYSPGTYIRNPIGSTHTPYSKDGCTIFVKLWQMQPDDQQRVVIDTTQASWTPGAVDGLWMMPLHTYGSERVALVKWEPGIQFNYHTHPGGEEVFVLEGVFEDEFGSYPKGTWVRNPPGSQSMLLSRGGGLIYFKTGHLQPESLAPQSPQSLVLSTH